MDHDVFLGRLSSVNVQVSRRLPPSGRRVVFPVGHLQAAWNKRSPHGESVTRAFERDERGWTWHPICVNARLGKHIIFNRQPRQLSKQGGQRVCGEEEIGQYTSTPRGFPNPPTLSTESQTHRACSSLFPLFCVPTNGLSSLSHGALVRRAVQKRRVSRRAGWTNVSAPSRGHVERKGKE